MRPRLVDGELVVPRNLSAPVSIVTDRRFEPSLERLLVLLRRSERRSQGDEAKPDPLSAVRDSLNKTEDAYPAQAVTYGAVCAVPKPTTAAWCFELHLRRAGLSLVRCGLLGVIALNVALQKALNPEPALS